MNTTLQTFDFNGHSLRIFPTDDGQSFYAVAKDATDILGYRTANDGLRSVPDKHKGTHSVRTPGGNQEMLCIDESGLYRLILRSDKPEAEPFMEWVTDEILPSIRKTGSYTAHPLGTTYQELITAHQQENDRLHMHAHALQAELLDLYRFKVATLEGKIEKPVRRSTRPVTEEEKAEIIRLHDLGMTRDEIAEHLDRGKTSVYYTLRDAGKLGGAI